AVAMLVIGVMALAALSVPSTRAVHDDTLFELGPGKSSDEGGKTNILGDGDASNGPDWADIFNGAGTYLGGFGGLAGTFIKDDTSQSGSSDRTTFSGAGGSNKNNDPIAPPGDTWHWDSGNVPAKDDLVNVYAYATLNPLTGHGCNGADTICAFNNGGTIDGGPWPNFDRHGSVITSLTKNSFTEFGFDASALFSETPCITTIMGKTRSSQSFTAEL